MILNSLGACLTRLGRPDEARTVLEASLTLSRRARRASARGARAWPPSVTWRSTRTISNGAADCFEHRAIRATRHRRSRGEGWMHLRLADLRKRIGDVAGARAASEAAAAAASASADPALAPPRRVRRRKQRAVE